MTVAIAQGTDSDLNDLDKLADSQPTDEKTGDGDKVETTKPTTITTIEANKTPKDTKQDPTKTDAPATTKTTTSTKATTTTTAEPITTANTTCANCLEADTRDPECRWNAVEEKTDYHIERTGNCPCPDDNDKDRCQVVQRSIRNIPALQAWSASLFLMSICIAGKIHTVRTPNFSVIFQ